MRYDPQNFVFFPPDDFFPRPPLPVRAWGSRQPPSPFTFMCSEFSSSPVSSSVIWGLLALFSVCPPSPVVYSRVDLVHRTRRSHSEVECLGRFQGGPAPTRKINQRWKDPPDPIAALSTSSASCSAASFLGAGYRAGSIARRLSWQRLFRAPVCAPPPARAERKPRIRRRPFPRRPRRSAGCRVLHGGWTVSVVLLNGLFLIWAVTLHG